MKAAVLNAPSKIAVEKVPKPIPRKNCLLVEIKAVGICGTDVETYRGRYSLQYPIIMGHEAAGIVVDVGKDVADFQLGDRVMIDPIFYCGKCPMCRIGKTNLCENGGLLGRDEANGAFAEFLSIHQNMVFKIGERISYEEGALIELLATALHGQNRVKIAPGDSVVVLGMGPAGLLHTKLANLSKACPIIVTSRSDWKLKLALEYGKADLAINPLREDPVKKILKETNGKGAKIVIEAAGIPKTVKQANEIIRSGGSVLQFGIVCDKINNYDMLPIYSKEAIIFGSRAYTEKEIKQAIALVDSKEIELSTLITHRFSLEGIEEALLTHENSAERLRVIIKP